MSHAELEHLAHLLVLIADAMRRAAAVPKAVPDTSALAERMIHETEAFLRDNLPG